MWIMKTYILTVTGYITIWKKTTGGEKDDYGVFFHVAIVPELFSLDFEEGLRPKYQQYM